MTPLSGTGQGMLPEQRSEAITARKFRVVLVKPSHYDDDGYVILWYRSPMPANSLASVYGLIDDCAQRKILGPDIEIDIVAIDETNTRVRVDRIIAEMRANGNFGFVGLVGVQSNQYPRSLHIAKPLREAGIPVIAINVATYWSALRANGIDDRIRGFGALLAEH